MTTPKLAIYACGGCGSNLIQHVIQIPNRDGFIDVEKSIIDTSESNITVNIGKENIGHTFIKGVTGMGQNRRLANEALRSSIDGHLNQNKPGTFNIVLFGTSGGTGSTAGPLIANELLKRGLPTLCMIVASTEGGRETENTLNTLKTLQNLSRVNKAPLLIAYYENGNELTIDAAPHRCIGSRTKVNTKIASDVQRVALMCSEQHIGLDREDVNNWVNYNKVTSVAPGLAELIILTDEDDYDPYDGKVITTASLFVEADELVPDLVQPYAIKGHYRENVSAGMEVPSMHFLTSTAFISGIVSNIKATHEMYTQAQAQLLTTTGLESELDEGDDPMVF